ncbi:MAG: phosphoribosylaminoimidazolesuccinocarboxamide synthase [Vicingaceae bacterium]
MTKSSTEFNFPGQLNVYHGKVRDVYNINNKHLVMVASDRISAFDHILPQRIPFKGQVLNQIAAYFLKATADLVPNWVEVVPDPNVTIGKYCEAFKVEMVVRAYLCGHAWREYQAGKRTICGVEMPDGMKENQAFPKPILTPTTKAVEGHDEDISREEILKQGIVSEADYLQLEEYSLKLFAKGTEMAQKQGLILVDTKYEFGKIGDTIYLIDEIHTPDSSRYFYAEGYEERLAKGERQRQLSKEFVREWLIEQGFQGKEGQQMPNMPEEFVQKVSERYIELFEKITGKSFEKADPENVEQRIEKNVLEALKKLN